MMKLITLIIVISVITFPKLSFAKDYTLIVGFNVPAFLGMMNDLELLNYILFLLVKIVGA